MIHNRIRKVILLSATMFALTITAAPQAHAGFWCDKAAEFEGHCDTCNAMCILERWVTGE